MDLHGFKSSAAKLKNSVSLRNDPFFAIPHRPASLSGLNFAWRKSKSDRLRPALRTAGGGGVYYALNLGRESFLHA